ncbi:putative ribonuclease H-like domain-containing protein [Tanacetum coccineum]
MENEDWTIYPDDRLCTVRKKKAQRRLEVKARSTLMMGIPNEHQLKFKCIKDAKKLLEAAEKRFGRNTTTRKTQRNLLKQQYENFTASSSEMLDQTFDRLQKLVRSFGSFGIWEKRSFNQTVHKEGNIAREYRAPRNQDNKNKESSRRSVPVETSTFTDLVSCDGLGGYDWSDQAEEWPNYALMAFSSLSPDSKVSNDSICSKSCLETVELLKSQNDQLLKDIKESELMVIVPPLYIGNFMPPTPDLSFTGLYEFVNGHVAEVHSLMVLQTVDPPYSQDPNSSYDDGSKPSSDDGKKVDKDPRKESECNNQEKEDNVNSNNNVNSTGTNEVNVVVSPIPTTRIHKDHPLDQVIRDLQSATQTRKMSKNLEEHGKNPKRNKKDERGIVIRNKARLVFGGDQGVTHQEKGLTMMKSLPVARIEAIRLFLAYASFKDFMVYQMDVKSAFLYKKIEEEVYVCQPPGFEDPDFPDRVYKVEKALYGLHQAPRAWYETLSTYLLDNGFQRGKIDKTLFIKRNKGDILLVQVYVDDIIFGSTKKELCIAFEKLMHEKFQMSSMGELTFFLGLQVQQKKDGIFISQDKYVVEILKKFGFTEVKTTSTPMETQNPLLKDENGKEVDVHMYRSMIGSLMYLTSSRPDIMFAVCTMLIPTSIQAYTNSDYAGASLDRKSTTRGCQFLRCRLISWQCKKQTVVANSTTKAEYVAASSCYGQVLWIQNQLLDYGCGSVDCLTILPLLEQLTLYGCLSLKITAWNEFSSTMASAIIYEAIHKELGDSLVRAATTASSLEAE